MCIMSEEGKLCRDCGCGFCKSDETACCRSTAPVRDNCHATSEGATATGCVFGDFDNFSARIDQNEHVCLLPNIEQYIWTVGFSDRLLESGCGCVPSANEVCKIEVTNENRCYFSSLSAPSNSPTGEPSNPPSDEPSISTTAPSKSPSDEPSDYNPTIFPPSELSPNSLN